MGWRLDRFLFLVIVFLTGGIVVLELQPASSVSLPPMRPLADRPLHAVPVAWTRFAQLVQDQFKALLEANDGAADRVRLFLKNRAADGDPASSALFIQVWVGADGKVERVVFPPLEDRQAEADLHRILEQRDIGPPPPDMPQPLRLKLALDGRNGI